MVMGFINGQMEEDLWENIKKTKSKDMAFTSGQMVASIKVTG